MTFITTLDLFLSGLSALVYHFMTSAARCSTTVLKGACGFEPLVGLLGYICHNAYEVNLFDLSHTVEIGVCRFRIRCVPHEGGVVDSVVPPQ